MYPGIKTDSETGQNYYEKDGIRYPVTITYDADGIPSVNVDYQHPIDGGTVDDIVNSINNESKNGNVDWMPSLNDITNLLSAGKLRIFNW